MNNDKINDKVIFNLTFSGSYQLFKYIIQTYNTELPYAGLIQNFLRENNYSERANAQWRCINGVNIKVWNILQKDLTISWLCGRIKDKPWSLEEIKKQFLENKNYKLEMPPIRKIKKKTNKFKLIKKDLDDEDSIIVNKFLKIRKE